MNPEEQVNQFNTEISKQIQETTETITKVKQGLEQDEEIQEEIRQLHQNYTDLSKKRIYFTAEREEFSPTQTVKPLKQPSWKDHEGKRGLEASEPDLIEHKKHLDKRKENKLRETEELYRDYRQGKNMGPVEDGLDITSSLEEVEGLKQEKQQEINALRNYLRDLRKIQKGEKTVDETPYKLPETEEIINDQIERTSEKIYNNWESIKQKQENIEEAFQNLEKEKEKLDAIEIGVKYGIRPVESTYEGLKREINEQSRNWDSLAKSLIDHLPEQYNQRITEKKLRV